MSVPSFSFQIQSGTEEGCNFSVSDSVRHQAERGKIFGAQCQVPGSYQDLFACINNFLVILKAPAADH